MTEQDMHGISGALYEYLVLCQPNGFDVRNKPIEGEEREGEIWGCLNHCERSDHLQKCFGLKQARFMYTSIDVVRCSMVVLTEILLAGIIFHSRFLLS